MKNEEHGVVTAAQIVAGSIRTQQIASDQNIPRPDLLRRYAAQLIRQAEELEAEAGS